MIQIILVYDEQDFDPVEQDGLGYFFQACATHIKRHITPNERFEITEIVSDSLDQGVVVKTLSGLQGNHFILLAYSHGRADALLYKNQQLAYLSAEEHRHLLKGSMFYTWACSCGLLLGPQAVDQGCKAFIGYTDLVVAGSWLTDVFVDTANYGLLTFLDGTPIEQAYKGMMANYDRHIDEVYQQSTMVASFLRRNRDALVLLGQDLGITLHEFDMD